MLASSSRRLQATRGFVVLAVICNVIDTGTSVTTSGCEPWPDCAASWVEAALRERAAAGAPLDDMLVAIAKASAQNCSRSTQCASEKRIEEIDDILSGLQKRWEEQAVAALAARSKVEDSLWKRWIKEARQLVEDMERLEQLRDEKGSSMSDVWLQRMSAVALDASLLPNSPALASDGTFKNSLDENANLTVEDAFAGWSRGGALRKQALSDSWSMRKDSPPNITRGGVLSTVENAAKCLLRELLDAAVEEGDVVLATCPPNAKADCFEVTLAVLARPRVSGRLGKLRSGC